LKVSEAKVVLTGGGSGIGRFLADELCAAGADVVVLEKDAQLAEELNQLNRTNLRAFACDVTDEDIVRGVLEAVCSSGFFPTVLINNAGLIHSEPLVNMLSRGDRTHSLSSWQKVLTTNLNSVFIVTKHVVDRMMAKRVKGTVISISSVAAAGNPGQSAYSAAKSAVNALTQCWSKELGVLGFRFVSIAPGFIDTPSTRSALAPAIIERLQGQIPLRRLGGLGSIWSSVRYAIENDYVTGTVLEVDGGLVL
jgi:3-oxoacyl-[acyl-carrier protein] reductase